MKIDDDQVHGGQIATRLWALNNIEAIGSDSEDEQLDKQPQDGGASLSRVVLYNEWSGGVSVVENQPGDWNVDDRLAHITSSAGIVLMCKLVNSAARNGLLLINRHRIEIVDVSVSDENAGPIDSSKTNVLLSTLDGEVDGNASVLRIPFEKQCYLRDFHVGGVPHHLVFDEDTGLIVVADRIFPTSVVPLVIPTSYLRLLDPCDGGQVHTEISLRPHEILTSLITWNTTGQKRSRYICVGIALCGDRSLYVPPEQPIPKLKRGRLIIYKLPTRKHKNRTKSILSSRQDSSSTTSLGQITGKGGYELECVWESERENPVVALASMGDSYLVVGTRKMCVVLRLDVVQKQLIECCKMHVALDIYCLYVHGYDIVASLAGSRVHVLRFVPAQSDDDEDRLILKNSEPFIWHNIESCYLSNNIVAGVYSQRYLYGARKQSPLNADFDFHHVFRINLGAKCSLIQQGCLVKSVCRPKHVLPWTDSTQLDKQDDHAQTNEMGPDYGAVATTDSGTMWTLVRISSQAYILLKELERAMCAFACGHPARPLLASGGSVDRARCRTSIRCSNAIDGTVSTAFISYLTLDEQLQVVASSDELQRLALALDIDIVNLDHETDFLPTEEYIVQIICRLVWTINTVCVC
ncbi:hypothetical protein H4217_006018 [Coemansia sp. RSA 1939]|nr:hypothetical protein H4217_006018 [Coemansia sp. RSA 1939]